jgi:hypothetical protein
LTGKQPGLTLSGANSWCVRDATVGGSITISNGAKVFIQNSTVSGSVTATGARRLALCGSTVSGSVTVSGSTGFVQIGDPEAGCAGNSVASNLQLTSNTGGVEVSGNSRIGGSATINNNSGTGPAPDAPAQEVEANRILGGLSCSGNTPSVTNSGQPNVVSGTRSGQCAGL